MDSERFRQIQDLFHAALEQPPDERDAFLETVCADDPDLRREVESLLQAHLHDGPVDRLADNLFSPPPEPPLPTLDGQTIAQYHLLERLGGGMSLVYKARDTRLNRTVALKLLPPHLSTDPDAKDRFLVEARAAAALDHANICTIHEIGQSDDGRLFIVMPFYAGETLKQKIARGPLPPAEALGYAVQMARGLARAHRRGIVHRDVKPANVLVTGEGQVKVVDFGIAKLSDVSLTRTGTTLGTVSYMSPEQARGEEVDARTDIWSLGVVLYEMVSGVRPFRGEREQVVLHAIREETPVPLAEMQEEVSPGLAAVVEKLLSKDPAGRYQTMDDVLADLTALREDPVLARATAGPVTARRLRGRRVFLYGSAVLLLAVLAVVGVRTLSSVRRPAIDSIAVLPLTNHSDDAGQDYFADGMTEELINTLGKVEGLRVAARTSSFAFKGKQADVREIGRRLGVASLLEGSVRKSGTDVRIIVRLIDAADGLQLWSRTFDRELADVVTVQNDIAEAVAQALRVELGSAATAESGHPARDVQAYEHYLKGRYFWNKRTEEGLKQAVEHFRQAIDRVPVYARAYAGLAEAYCILGFYDWLPPQDAFSRARAAAEKALEIDPALAEPYNALGYIALYYEWNWEDAERQFLRALERDPDYAVAHQWYANFLTAMGRFDEAAREMQRGLEHDPLSLINSAALGWTYSYAGRHEQAIEAFRKTLEMDPSFVLAYLWLGQTYDRMGRFEEAIDTLTYAVALSRRDPIAVAALAHAHARKGEKDAATALLRELEAGRSRRYVPPYEIAAVYAALDRKERALDWLDRALEERSHSIAFLKIDPQLRPLQPEPRFRQLLQQVGLE